MARGPAYVARLHIYRPVAGASPVRTGHRVDRNGSTAMGQNGRQVRVVQSVVEQMQDMAETVRRAGREFLGRIRPA